MFKNAECLFYVLENYRAANAFALRRVYSKNIFLLSSTQKGAETLSFNVQKVLAGKKTNILHGVCIRPPSIPK